MGTGTAGAPTEVLTEVLTEVPTEVPTGVPTAVRGQAPPMKKIARKL
ncbi:MAG TPA: hypothetical protein GXX18_03365 [Bacillales bacterium]|nr:hypothetical protein [Bacillales bacterium]